MIVKKSLKCLALWTESGGGGYWQCTMFYAGITSSTNISQGSENELTM